MRTMLIELAVAFVVLPFWADIHFDSLQGSS